MEEGGQESLRVTVTVPIGDLIFFFYPIGNVGLVLFFFFSTFF